MQPLSRALEEDLQWREAELVSLKLVAAAAEAGTVRHDATLRALMALLYAHYEGYCRFALVNRAGIPGGSIC